MRWTGFLAPEELYPFGFGLSYSQYAYDNLKLSQTSLHAGDSLGVDVDVSNRSKRDGDEVVELYLSFPKVAGAPLRALRGFVRIHLATGAQQHVHLDLSGRDLSMVNESGDRVIAAGDYGISIGGGQPTTGTPGVQATFAIHGEQTLPE